jgi:hypothetical protein
MELTNEDYKVLRIFLLKVINQSTDSLTPTESYNAEEVLRKFIND